MNQGHLSRTNTCLTALCPRCLSTSIPKVMGPNIKLNPLGVLLVVVALIGSLIYLFGLPTSWFAPPPEISMKQLLAVGIYLAQKGGVEVIAVHNAKTENVQSKGMTDVGKKDLRTEGDLKSHTAIVHGFKEAFPNLLVVSEEHTKLEHNPNLDQRMLNLAAVLDGTTDQSIPVSELAVWVDPLDATQEYTEKDKTLLTYVTVMICVVHKGKPIMGIIHQPFASEDASNKTYWAWVGHGQSSNLPKVGMKTEPPNKDKYTFVISRSHKGKDVENSINEAFPGKVVVKEAAGAGYKVLDVVRGQSDAYVHMTKIKKWDICAGHAIVSHRNGKMTTLKGDEIDFSPHSNPVNPDGLLVSLSGESQTNFRSKLKPAFEKIQAQKKEEAKKT